MPEGTYELVQAADGYIARIHCPRLRPCSPPRPSTAAPRSPSRNGASWG